VLVPVLDALRAEGERMGAIPAVRATATASREATKDMLATRGRASFLGERSIGHYDPGATSSMLLIQAVCDALEGRA
jgi:dihydroxyacetone kinase-like protein